MAKKKEKTVADLNEAFKDPPLTKDSVLTFGKHKSYTLGRVIQEDPSYVLWLHKNVARISIHPRTLAAAQKAVEDNFLSGKSYRSPSRLKGADKDRDLWDGVDEMWGEMADAGYGPFDI